MTILSPNKAKTRTNKNKNEETVLWESTSVKDHLPYCQFWYLIGIVIFSIACIARLRNEFEKYTYIGFLKLAHIMYISIVTIFNIHIDYVAELILKLSKKIT